MFQIAVLSEKPSDLPLHWIEQGMDVSLENNNNPREPFSDTQFAIQYSGPDGNILKQTVQLDPVFGRIDLAVQNSNGKYFIQTLYPHLLDIDPTFYP